MNDMQVNPQPVMVGTEQVGWGCPVCKAIYDTRIVVYREDNLKEGGPLWDMAKTHCYRRCEECGADIKSQAWVLCGKCRDAAEAKKELALFEKATKIDPNTYEGAVCLPDNETYYSSYEDFLDSHDDAAPEFLWACTPEKFTLDAENIVSNELSNHYEDAFEGVSDKELKVLQGLLDEWTARQAIESWQIDYSRVIVLNNTCATCDAPLWVRDIADNITQCDDCIPEKA